MSGVLVRSPARLAMQRFRGRPAAVAGLVVIMLFVLVAVFAPLIAQYDPEKTSWTLIRKAPSLAHWMGTDENGRDVFARVLFGDAGAGLLQRRLQHGRHTFDLRRIDRRLRRVCRMARGRERQPRDKDEPEK